MENWLNVNPPKDRSFEEKLEVKGTPKVYILDKNGNLVSRYFNEDVLKNELYK